MRWQTSLLIHISVEGKTPSSPIKQKRRCGGRSLFTQILALVDEWRRFMFWSIHCPGKLLLPINEIRWAVIPRRTIGDLAVRSPSYLADRLQVWHYGFSSLHQQNHNYSGNKRVSIRLMWAPFSVVKRLQWYISTHTHIIWWFIFTTPPKWNLYRNVRSKLLLVSYIYYILNVNIAERLVAQGIIKVTLQKQILARCKNQHWVSVLLVLLCLKSPGPRQLHTILCSLHFSIHNS